MESSSQIPLDVPTQPPSGLGEPGAPPATIWGTETTGSTTWGTENTALDWWNSEQNTAEPTGWTEESNMSVESTRRSRVVARIGSLATKFIKKVDSIKTKNAERMSSIRSRLGNIGLHSRKNSKNEIVLAEDVSTGDRQPEPNNSEWDIYSEWYISSEELDALAAKKEAQIANEIAEKNRAAAEKEEAYKSAYEAYDGPGAVIRERAQSRAELRGDNITEIPNLVDAEDSIDLSPWGTAAEQLFGENLDAVVSGAMERSPFVAETEEVKNAFTTYFTENCLAATIIEDMLSGDIDKESARWSVLREYDGADATLGLLKKAIESNDEVREKERAMMLGQLLEANATLFKEESLPMLGVSTDQVKAIYTQRLRLRAQFDAIIAIDGSALQDRGVMNAYAHMKPYDAQRALDDPVELQNNLNTQHEYTILDIRPYDSPVFHNTPYSEKILDHGSFVSSYMNAEMHGGRRMGPNSNASNLAHSVLPHWSETPTIFNNKPGFGHEPAYRQESEFNGSRPELFSPATFVKSIGDVISELPVSRGAVFGVARIKEGRSEILQKIPVPSRDYPERGYTLSPNYGDGHRDGLGDDREFLPGRHKAAALKNASLPVSPDEKVNIGASYEQGRGMPDVSSAEALELFTKTRIEEGGNADKYVVPLRAAKKLYYSESSSRNDIGATYVGLPVAA